MRRFVCKQFRRIIWRPSSINTNGRRQSAAAGASTKAINNFVPLSLVVFSSYASESQINLTLFSTVRERGFCSLDNSFWTVGFFISFPGSFFVSSRFFREAIFYFFFRVNWCVSIFSPSMLIKKCFGAFRMSTHSLFQFYKLSISFRCGVAIYIVYHFNWIPKSVVFTWSENQWQNHVKSPFNLATQYRINFVSYTILFILAEKTHLNWNVC